MKRPHMAHLSSQFRASSLKLDTLSTASTPLSADPVPVLRPTARSRTPTARKVKIMARQGEDIHAGEPGFLHQLGRRRRLESLFLFITSRCNSRCRTCFYSEELNSHNDMTFDEIRRVSETAPRFDKLWLSGGEPFLRRDLVDIIEMFYEHNGIRSINLPTNGLLPQKVEESVATLLERCPKLTIHLNVSVDGLEVTHDRVRGVDGGWARAIDTLERVSSRFEGHDRLHRNVATVVTPESLAELRTLAQMLLDRGLCSTQFFEAMRGTPRDSDIGSVSALQLRALHEELLPVYETMAKRLFSTLKAPKAAKLFAENYFLGVIGFAFQLHERNLEGPSHWGMDCTAGQTTLVIDHDGRLRSCELREPFGRLQDFDFDLDAALRSSALRGEVMEIGGGTRANCWCTHTCWILASMQFSPTTLVGRIPAAGLGWRLRQRAREFGWRGAS